MVLGMKDKDTMDKKENERNKSLCLDLLHADSEEEVINILKKGGYWDDPTVWRLYGDKEGNFAQIGNQSSFAEAALVEKIVNAIDARMMCECKKRGIQPESDEAPQSLRDAVAQFFEGRRAIDDEAGSLVNWPKAKRAEESKYITVAATGGRPRRGSESKKMCLTIADQGEGQSPKRLPHTILSLNDKNKQRIRFVQGKFNMGGSGALRFCCKNGLQLVITKRNPQLALQENVEDDTVEDWGVTVVRREEPSNKSGEPIHSEFTYLAPINAKEKPRGGEVIRFKSKTLKLMPYQNEPYYRDIEWGTIIKLYEYETNVGQSNIILPDGLLYAIERLLPEMPLPIHLHECRDYKGEKFKSYNTPLAGLVVRLEDGKGDNLEPGFPLSVQLCAAGMKMSARIYVFKEDRASTYLKDEGVIFAINGQSHGYLPKSIFSQPKAVGLQRLKDSLLVLIDCSSLTARQREDLFMSSRDRLSKNAIRYEVEREIEEMLRENPELKRLQQKRREEDVNSRLSEEKPLEEVLGKVLKASPTLKRLFLLGQRLPKPFVKGGGEIKGEGDGLNEGAKNFKGRKHPTYFKIVNKQYGELYERNCEEGRRCRIKFETDVENEYFKRPTDRGKFELLVSKSSCKMTQPNYSLVLEDGEAFLNMALPVEAKAGDWLMIQTSVNDPTLQEPFRHVIKLMIMPKQLRPPRPKGRRRRHGGSGEGSENTQQGIELPKIEPVYKGDKYWIKYKFDESTACHVITDPIVKNGETQYEHVFYINMDNISLKTEMKYSKQDVRLLEAKYKYGNVLLGLAILHQDGSSNEITDVTDKNDSERHVESVQDRIRNVSRAVAPVLLPMIDQLAGLNENDIESGSVIGED